MKVSRISKRLAKMRWHGVYGGEKCRIVWVKPGADALPEAYIAFDTIRGQERLLVARHSPKTGLPEILLDGVVMGGVQFDVELLERFLFVGIRLEYSFFDAQDVPQRLCLKSRLPFWVLLI